MPDQLAPFHHQAEEIGRFLRAERARAADTDVTEIKPLGPSENTD